MPRRGKQSHFRRVGFGRFVRVLSVIPFLAALPRVGFAQSLFGLRLGMPTRDALVEMRKPADVVKVSPRSNGKRVVSDSISLARCGITLRRSVGFDSSDRLSVIGLTHRATPTTVDAELLCAYDWLTEQFGPESDKYTINGVLIRKWDLEGATLTIEAKAYNERDQFILIYLYR